MIAEVVEELEPIAEVVLIFVSVVALLVVDSVTDDVVLEALPVLPVVEAVLDEEEDVDVLGDGWHLLYAGTP